MTVFPFRIEIFFLLINFHFYLFCCFFPRFSLALSHRYLYRNRRYIKIMIQKLSRNMSLEVLQLHILHFTIPTSIVEPEKYFSTSIKSMNFDELVNSTQRNDVQVFSA